MIKPPHVIPAPAPAPAWLTPHSSPSMPQEGDTLVMVLELVRGGSLDQARKRLGGRMGEQWALHLVVLPLLRVLSHLHRLGVVHRDVKPVGLLGGGPEGPGRSLHGC